MAKSAEGDAVARLSSAAARGLSVFASSPRSGTSVLRDGWVIPDDEISEELGYEIDAYLDPAQEMSPHYGRMVATDDALMLFSDPTEAMEHLLS